MSAKKFNQLLEKLNGKPSGHSAATLRQLGVTLVNRTPIDAQNRKPRVLCRTLDGRPAIVG